MFRDPYKPKYLQLFDIIKDQIASGELMEGDRVLSENELKEQYDVSSTTVRKCLDILRNEGFIERKQGVGTFVKHGQIERSLQKILSFTKNMEQVGRKPSTVVLEKEVYSTYGPYHAKLALSEGEALLMIKRLRNGDGEPMMLEKRYINISLCPGIDDEDLSGSLYDLYELRFGIRLRCAKQHLRLQFLDDADAKLLHCEHHAPAFLVTGITYGNDDVPLEYEESLYRGDVHEFYVDIRNC
jgi:GntR family transcriptional regulator